MLVDALVDRAEVREREPLRPSAADQLERGVPGVDVDVGRRRRGGDEVRGRDAHTGDVADEGRARRLV